MEQQYDVYTIDVQDTCSRSKLSYQYTEKLSTFMIYCNLNLVSIERLHKITFQYSRVPDNV